jgi:hypothetical protein
MRLLAGPAQPSAMRLARKYCQSLKVPGETFGQTEPVFSKTRLGQTRSRWHAADF